MVGILKIAESYWTIELCGWDEVSDDSYTDKKNDVEPWLQGKWQTVIDREIYGQGYEQQAD